MGIQSCCHKTTCAIILITPHHLLEGEAVFSPNPPWLVVTSGTTYTAIDNDYDQVPEVPSSQFSALLRIG